MIRVQREDFDVGAELERLAAGNHRIGGIASFIGLVRDMSPSGAAGGGGESVDAEGAGLGLHQPVAHRMNPCSVTTASIGTSCAAGSMCPSSWKE